MMSVRRLHSSFARTLSLLALGAVLLVPPEAHALPLCNVAAACTPSGYNCGTVACVGLKTVVCGTCTLPETCGGGGATNVCGCTPTVTKCAAGQNCGTIDNGCGGKVTCGPVCPLGQVCAANVCVPACSPITACPVGNNCGTISDGCGGTVTCGALGGLCPAGESCMANVCKACVPLVACPAGNDCGSVPDGCGGVVACGALAGACPAGETCAGNTCKSCSPTTCAAQGKDCGSISDGCGGALSCGVCGAPKTCGGGGVANVCGTGATGGGGATISFPAGSLVVPMDQCYNPADPSAPVVSTDWVAGACGTSAAGDLPPCWSHSYAAGNVRKPFGLLYLLAINHIPVYVINNPTKVRLTDADFTVTPPAGATVNTVMYLDPAKGYAADKSAISTGTNPVSYWGMPFVVEASYAQQALQLLTEFNANPALYVPGNALDFTDVPVHVVNHPFSAPVMSVIASRPKPLGISPTNFFDTFFDDSAITAVVPFGVSGVHLKQTQAPTAANGMSSLYEYAWDPALDPHPVCAGGTCNALVYTDGAGILRRTIDTIWTDDDGLQYWRDKGGLLEFFQAGGRALVVGRAIKGGTSTGVLSWETGTAASMNFLSSSGIAGHPMALGNYCASLVGATGAGVSGPTAYYPASDPYLQLGGLAMDPIGGGLAGNFSFNTTAAPGTFSLYGGSSDNHTVIHGHPVVNGSPTAGDLIYESASNAWSGAAGRKDSGLHILFNTLVAGSDGAGGHGGAVQQYVPIELTRSSPVGRNTGEIYVGTFNWKIPEDPSGFGSILYQAPKDAYPYVTGHFREFKPTSTAGLVEVACDPSAVNTGCNWDLALTMKAWSTRSSRVFIGGVSGGTYAMKAASSLGGDASIAYIGARIGNKLGGIDHATAAVVEGKPNGFVTVAGAQQRPTITYVGGYDGMLHAVCVVPEPGATRCYGSYSPGEEIWAFMPPGAKAALDAAVKANDFSGLNVGGVIRVADMQEAFGGASPSFRTVLLLGERDMGRIVALDISNPNPGNVNQDGFKLLWEQDGTNVATGVTAYAMGKTQGATLAAYDRSTVAIVTSATSDPNKPGINTYAVQLSDGKIIAANQKLYSRRAPTAGGVNTVIPNDVPPLPVVVDSDGDGIDETVLVADFEGKLRRVVLDKTTHTFASGGDFYDASGGCASGVACQPIGVSPSIGRHGLSNALAVYVGTGGADWARSPTTQSFVAGMDLVLPKGVSVATPFFTSNLGTIDLPLPKGTPNTSFPIRVYAQLTIAGTDLYAQATSLSIDTINQLIQPSLYPGTYGNVLRWGKLNGTVDSSPTYLIAQGTTFGAGAGSILQTNTTNTDGILTILGTSQAQRIALAADSSSLRNKLYAVDQSVNDQRFRVLTWFDLSN